MSSTRKRTSLQAPTVVMTSTKPGVRMSMSGGGGSSLSMSRRNVMRSSMAPPMHAKGELQAKTRQAVSTVVDGKNKEKAEMNHLNVKLASLLENQLLSAQTNQMLQDQVERLKKEKTPDTGEIRAEYMDEITQLRDANGDMKLQIADYEPKLMRLKETVEARDEEIALLKRQNLELENTIRKLTEKIADLEAELAQLRMGMDTFGQQLSHKDQEIARLKADLEAAQNDLENARRAQIEATNLWEEEKTSAEFDADAYGEEIKNLQQQVELLKRCQPIANKDELKFGFKAAIQQLQDKYNDDMEQRLGLMKSQYESQILRLENANAQRKPDQVDSVMVRENKSLKSKMDQSSSEMLNMKRELDEARRKLAELQEEYEQQCRECEEEKAGLRVEIENVERELEDALEDMRQLEIESMSLQSEIATYRQLLDGKTGSLQSTLEQSQNMQSRAGAMMGNIISSGSASQNSTVSQSSGRVNIQKKCKGPLQFSECKQDGSNIEVENTSSKSIDISEYTIEREGNKGKKLSFVFPAGTTLNGGSRLRVFGNAFDDEARECKPGTYLVAPKGLNSWSVGNCTFSFLNKDKPPQTVASLTMTYSS